LKVKTQVN
jgi:Tetratricopeptide repeat